MEIPMLYYMKTDTGDFVPVMYDMVLKIGASFEDLMEVSKALGAVLHSAEAYDREAYDRSIHRLAKIGSKLSSQPLYTTDDFDRVHEWTRTGRDPKGSNR